MHELNCPIDFALGIFGDRWTLLVIRDLLFFGKRHFHEIIASQEGIASNILAARLRKLEREGVVSRTADPKNRKQVIYELTAKGLDLLPILLETIRWSGKHDPHTAAPRPFLRRLEKDRKRLIVEIMRALRERKPVFGSAP
jgi:DNA-binding HxlR family transcriptional regulator